MRDVESGTRPEADYKNLSEKFRLQSRDYSKQFAHIYADRLNRTRDCLLERISEKWGPSVSVLKLSELNESSGDECVIIGTFFKHQQLKPSILKELSEELKLVPQPQHTHYVSDTDELILEDELQRIVVVGDINIHSHVSGVVAAVKGVPVGNGKFNVSDVIHATPTFKPRVTSSSNIHNKKVVFISNITSAQKPILPELYSLMQLLTGWISDYEDTANIVRVVIAGKVVRGQTKEVSILSNKFDSMQADLEAVDIADQILSDLVSNVDVELMPGEFDPTNTTLPQQPLHPCLFPKASKYSTFHSVTNPHMFEVEGRLFLGSSGQPVDDIAKFSNTTNPIDILEYTLRCGHVAPTAPDTLACYPYYKDDPMVIDNCPDVYFAGNQSQFGTKLLEMGNGQKVRLIAVPDFSVCKTVAVLDLETLDCYNMVIGDFTEDR